MVLMAGVWRMPRGSPEGSPYLPWRGSGSGTPRRAMHQPPQGHRRGLATRCDKVAIAYQATLHLAGILIWTRR